MKLLGKYTNGNYQVYIFDDGTKVRLQKHGEELKPKFPESIDMKISNRCNIGCSFCHENSTPEGNIASLKSYENFLLSLNPFTEIALGGGALSLVPEEDLMYLFDLLYYRNVITNITINQNELYNEEFVKFLHFCIKEKFIRGIGISFIGQSKILEDFVKKYRKQVVIHVINGLISKEDLQYLSKLNCKLLILGYKEFGRGLLYSKKFNNIIENNKKYLESIVRELPKSFKTVSFDCLAVSQLNLKDKVSDDDWKKLYMGNDGSFTMYVDLVNGTYATSSTTNHTKRYELNSHNTAKDIFKHIREENGYV